MEFVWFNTTSSSIVWTTQTAPLKMLNYFYMCSHTSRIFSKNSYCKSYPKKVSDFFMQTICQKETAETISSTTCFRWTRMLLGKLFKDTELTAQRVFIYWVLIVIKEWLEEWLEAPSIRELSNQYQIAPNSPQHLSQ